MRDQIDRLTRLATDLLDLSRLDAGQLEVEIVPFDLARPRGSWPTSSGPWRSPPSTSCRPRRRSPVEALGDELRVQQIARALVENAIRHTPPGTTRDRPRRSGAAHGAVLEVRDDGPGIPAEDQKHLFQRFYRAAGGKASGSGLGLAIASELASRLGGSIELSSRPGATVFTLNLPGRAGSDAERQSSWQDVAS